MSINPSSNVASGLNVHQSQRAHQHSMTMERVSNTAEEMQTTTTTDRRRNACVRFLYWLRDIFCCCCKTEERQDESMEMEGIDNGAMDAEAARIALLQEKLRDLQAQMRVIERDLERCKFTVRNCEFRVQEFAARVYSLDHEIIVLKAGYYNCAHKERHRDLAYREMMSWINKHEDAKSNFDALILQHQNILKAISELQAECGDE